MRNPINKILTIIIIQVVCLNVAAQRLPVVKPESVKMSSEALNRIDDLVEKAISDKQMPGAVVVVGRKGKIVFRKAFGKRAIYPKSEAMTLDTVFDLASLTKPIATATSIMILAERGQLRLSDKIGRFIPGIADPQVREITILELLTHTSGFAPDFDLGKVWSGNEGMLRALADEKLRNSPGSKFVYSDIGFIVLGEIVKRVANEPLDEFAARNIFAPLGFLRSDLGGTGFLKFQNGSHKLNDDLKLRIAPTESVRGQQNYLGAEFTGSDKDGDTVLRGYVHDPTAYRMNGVAGHAGLFSTADDISIFCQMILNGGRIGRSRVLSEGSVRLLTKPNVVSETGATRGLGWDINTSFSSNRGELLPVGSFGHTGFTGTGIWIDPLSETFIIFLSNRVHPDGKGNIVDVRAKISTVVGAAVSDISLSRREEFEARYLAEINHPGDNTGKPIYDKQIRKSTTSVLTGIDVLEKEDYRRLVGLRIGLVTNQTGRNQHGASTIDILKNARNVRLTALFSPEHGIRGDLDQPGISDSLDEKTGLPIYSLYSDLRRPTKDQMNEIDAFVFDIQDIGTRFYTYIATLKNIIEEAAKSGKKVFVLDRPNPINGADIEGPIADAESLSFVVPHTLPIRHGMTVGEIALMINTENRIGADLQIVKMENWHREMWFDETNLAWINPSPNMRNLNQATLYPGVGILETTNVSVGRGTDTPFEIVGAPWINGRTLAVSLNRKGLPGVRFVPVIFTPKSSVFRGIELGGINIIITNRKLFKPVWTGLEIACSLSTIYKNEWEVKNLNRLLANEETVGFIKNETQTLEIVKKWVSPTALFYARRSAFLLYK